MWLYLSVWPKYAFVFCDSSNLDTASDLDAKPFSAMGKMFQVCNTLWEYCNFCKQPTLAIFFAQQLLKLPVLHYFFPILHIIHVWGESVLLNMDVSQTNPFTVAKLIAYKTAFSKPSLWKMPFQRRLPAFMQSNIIDLTYL